MVNYNPNFVELPPQLKILVARLLESGLDPTFVKLKWGEKSPVVKNWTDRNNRLSLTEIETVDYSQYGLGIVSDDRLVIVDIFTH